MKKVNSTRVTLVLMAAVLTGVLVANFSDIGLAFLAGIIVAFFGLGIMPLDGQ